MQKKSGCNKAHGGAIMTGEREAREGGNWRKKGIDIYPHL